jgi:hypothetical protein
MQRSHHSFWFIVRVGFALTAAWVAVTESWDSDGNGSVSFHEMLLFIVRFLAFPLHLLLSLTPGEVLGFFGLPNAYWPSSAALAIVISLPLWGVLLIGGLVAEAWLERSLWLPRNGPISSPRRSRATLQDYAESGYGGIISAPSASSVATSAADRA